MNNPASRDLSRMLVYIFILIGLPHTESINNITAIPDFPKCCDFNSAFVRENNSYYCNKSVNTRIFVQTSSVFDYYRTQWGECVESVNSHLYLFQVKSDTFTIADDITDMILPKCCLPGYSYVPNTHACTNNSKNVLFNSKMIRVGLPNCRVIYDYEFVSKDDFRIYKNFIRVPTIQEDIPNGKYCVDETTRDTFVVRVCKSIDFCRQIQCIHKCCFDGKSFVNGSNCTDTYVHGIDVEHLLKLDGNYSDNFGIIHGYETGVYIPNQPRFYVDEQGNFHSYEETMGKRLYSVEEETYCIEHATKNGIVYGHTLFRIIPQIVLEKKFLFNRWAMVTSCIFLILTIIFYLISGERSKVFGKILISFCTTLLVLFIFLIYNIFKGRTMATTLCKLIGFFLIYLSFSCFMWLQIMCYDIYYTFGSTKRFSSKNEKRKRDFKRFIYYSLYGWGFPLLFTLIPLTFHLIDILPAQITVMVAEKKCLIEKGDGNYAELLFYILPLTIIQLVNIAFFIKTVRYCLRVKGDIQKMNDSADLQKKKNKFRAQKERFGLIIKLSIIMGIFFLFEVVSSFYDFKNNSVTEHIEIVWDFINCLQGLFIFIVFICKVKNFKKCQRTIRVDKLRKISLSSNSTKMTRLSSDRRSGRDSRRKYLKGDAKATFS